MHRHSRHALASTRRRWQQLGAAVCASMAVAVIAAAMLVVPNRADAQQWQTLESSRQVRDSQAMRVHVTYGAGSLNLAPGSSRLLYHMQLRYDADRSTPRHEFDAGAHSLRVGLGKSGSGFSLRSGQEGSLDLSLARGVPMSLELELGAVEGMLELGGIALERLELRSGASDVTARFSTPNPATLSHISVESGAASVKLEQLGNANAQRISVNVGVGSVTLDFGGEWVARDIDVNVSVAVGGLTLRVPRGIAIDVDVSRTLASFKHGGLEQQGKRFVSTDTPNATHHLRLNGSATLGSVEIIRY